VRIRGEYGSPDFMAAYHAAFTGAPLPTKKNEVRAHSVKWLIDLYHQSAQWKVLSYATRKQRDQVYAQVITNVGPEHISCLTRAAIIAGRDRRASKPSAPVTFMKAIRSLCAWAVEAGHLPFDPCAGISHLRQKKKGSGFKVWQEDWVAQYEVRWPLGTKEQIWLAVLMYSGLRRGDAVRYGRQHVSGGKGAIGVRGGIGTIKLQKAEETVEVHLPILNELADVLERGPIGDMTFIVGSSGLPLTKESFGNYFRDACVAAGVPGRAHGLRKLAATRAANNGATDKELQALFGWTDYKMPQLYTRGADRRKLSMGAVEKMLPAKKHSSRQKEPHLVTSGLAKD
jgi:integrase